MKSRILHRTLALVFGKLGASAAHSSPARNGRAIQAGWVTAAALLCSTGSNGLLAQDLEVGAGDAPVVTDDGNAPPEGTEPPAGPGDGTNPGAPEGDMPQSSIAQVTDVFAVGDAVVVQVQLQGESSLSPHIVTVTGAEGELLGAAVAQPVEGIQEVILSETLRPERVADTLVANLDALDGSNVSALAFGVGLDCFASDECEFSLQPGAAGTAIAASTALSLALDAAAASGEPKDLFTLSQEQPELLGDILTYSAGLGKLGMATATAPGAPVLDLGPTPGHEAAPVCECWWEKTQELRPAWAYWVSGGSAPARYEGHQGPGAANWIRAWYDGNVWNGTHSSEYYVEGETEATLKLRCMLVREWRTMTIRIWRWTFTFNVPVTEGECPKKCVGTVESRVEFYADLKASIDTGWFSSGSAAAQEEGRFSINGQPILNRIAKVEKATTRNWGLSLAIPNLGSIVIGGGKMTVSGSPTKDFALEIRYDRNGSDGTVAHQITASTSNLSVEPTTALFEGKSLAFASGNMNTDSEGKATMSYQFSMYGYAPCARNPQAAHWNYYSFENRTDALRFNIKMFFAQRGMNVNP